MESCAGGLLPDTSALFQPKMSNTPMLLGNELIVHPRSGFPKQLLGFEMGFGLAYRREGS